MSLPRLRRRVDARTFTGWRAALPGLGLPAWFDIANGGTSTVVANTTPGVTVPPLVAAALAVHTDPQVTVLFAVRADGVATTGCVALGSGVVSALVQGASGGETAWVEVALVPTERAVAEVLRWIPPRPGGDASLEVQVVHAHEAMAGWVERWTARAGEGWQVDPPGAARDGSRGDGSAGDRGVGSAAPRDVAALACDLRFVLAGCLCTREAG